MSVCLQVVFTIHPIYREQIRFTEVLITRQINVLFPMFPLTPCFTAVLFGLWKMQHSKQSKVFQTTAVDKQTLLAGSNTSCYCSRFEREYNSFSCCINNFHAVLCSIANTVHWDNFISWVVYSTIINMFSIHNTIIEVRHRYKINKICSSNTVLFITCIHSKPISRKSNEFCCKGYSTIFVWTILQVLWCFSLPFHERKVWLLWKLFHKSLLSCKTKHLEISFYVGEYCWNLTKFVAFLIDMFMESVNEPNCRIVRYIML